MTTQRALELRRRTERRLVRKYLQAVIAAGYGLRVDDGEELFAVTRKLNTAMEQIFAVDEALVGVWKDGKGNGWLKFVFGNDGYDVLSDYTVNLESIVAPVNEYAGKLAA